MAGPLDDLLNPQDEAGNMMRRLVNGPRRVPAGVNPSLVFDPDQARETATTIMANAPPQTAPVPAPPAVATAAPAVAAPAPEIRVSSRAAQGGPVINNAGTLSDASGVIGFDPIRGSPSVLDDRGAAALGYARNLDNSLRRLGTPYDHQLGLMTELMRMAQQAAPGGPGRDQYIGEQMGNLMQHFAPTIMPNQLAQGQLDLNRAVQLGTGGTPGAIANAASDALNRTRENERYGPEARYDAFYNQAYNSFPQGTPHDARVRQLRSQGMAPPEFLGGRRQAGVAVNPNAPAGSTANQPRQIPGEDRNASAVDRAFSTGMSSFPTGPGGQRVIPTDNPGAVNNAITNIMSGLGDQHLRDPEVRQRLIDTFGTNALDSWLNTSNNFMNRFSIPGQNHQREIQRFLGLAGMRQQPITPFNAGASPLQRLISTVNPVVPIANYLTQ